MTCNVYIVKEGLHGPFKIGVARNPEKRLVGLQIGNPRDLSLVQIEPFDTAWKAKEAEQYVHYVFSSFRLRGEWFDVNLTAA